MARHHRTRLASARALCAVSTGCTGLPDRDEEVRRLESECNALLRHFAARAATA